MQRGLFWLPERHASFHLLIRSGILLCVLRMLSPTTGQLCGTLLRFAQHAPGCIACHPAEDADPIESPIPEQFVTRCRGGRWVTEPVAHSGA